MSLTVRSATRRLVVLTALNWLLRLLVEVRPPREGRLGAAVVRGARAVPATVAAAARLAVLDGPLRIVLLLTAVGGVALVAFELLGPPRFAELAGGPDEAAAVLGVVQSVSFGVAAGGALLAPALQRRLRGSTRWTCALLTVLGAAGVAGFGAGTAVVLAAGMMTAFYLAHAGQWPLLSAVLHTRVTAAERATAVSSMSLALTVGGTAGNLVLPRVADALGLRGAFLLVGALVLLSALLCLRLPRVVPLELAADTAA